MAGNQAIKCYVHQRLPALTNRLNLPAVFRATHLPLLSPGCSSAQALVMTCREGVVQVDSLQVVGLKSRARGVYQEWRVSVVDQLRACISGRQLLGWSVLAVPPTGSIVESDGQLHYQPGPDQPLQGEGFLSEPVSL